MSVSKDQKTGKWIAAYYVKGPDGKLKKAMKRGLPSKAAAQAWELSHKGKPVFDAGTMTLSEMFELMSQHNNASETTTAQRRGRFVKYAATLWAKPIGQISKADLLSWRADLRDLDLSTTTINDILGHMKTVFNYAETVHDVQNTAKILKNYKKTLDETAEEVMHIITPQQFNDLIGAEDEPLIRDFLAFLYLTGCRKGEARALFKTDYQERNGQKVIFVHQSMRRGEKSLKTTKTHETRYIPLDDKSIEIVERYIDRRGKYLFGDFHPVELTRLRDHFKADLKAAKLDPEIRIHDLRHSHVSLLWANNVPIPEISKRIGHSSPDITMRVYSHIFDISQSSSLKILNSLKIEV